MDITPTTRPFVMADGDQSDRSRGERSPSSLAAAHAESAPSAPIRRVMHIVDTLDAGGKERVAVNFVNTMPRDRYRMSLCTTRRDGTLAALVADDVDRLRIERRLRLDPTAITQTVAFVRAHGVGLLHAHGSSLFHARLVAQFAPYPAVVWHDHYGRCADDDRSVWLYRAATAGIGGVIAVNSQLAEWASATLRVPKDRVWYVPNFAVTAGASADEGADLSLPGTPETRIVCVAHLRPQKDHLTLLAALATVVRTCPLAQLLLVGDTVEAHYVDAVRREIAARGLDGHVSILGLRTDVPAILRASAVGVLSSESEGLPLALIEYGNCGVAAVATSVGECAAVLDEGRAGLLVPPKDPDALAGALTALLTSPARRRDLGERLQAHIERFYSQAQGVRRVHEIYDAVLGPDR